jgi:zinc transport system ATP-binding protein
MNQPLAHLQDAALGHAGRVVLSVPAFHASAGELVAVLGDNGSGKSTLLLSLCGAMKPIRGQVSRGVPSSQVGYLPQAAEVVGTLPVTVAEYVLLGLVGTKIRAATALEPVLTAAGIADLAARQAAALSGGQRRRMMLARALIRRPHLLLVDEPEAGMDAATRAFVLSEMQRLADGGACVVMATHDPAWAGHARRRYLLADGIAREEAA